MFNWPNDLVSDIARRTCVLYIGAGVSANSSSAKGISPPTWEAFLRSCLTKINKADCAYTEQLLSQKDLLSACEVIIDKIGTAEFNNVAQDAFRRPGFKPASIHETIYNLDARLVITPNVDKIYEQYAQATSCGTIVVKKQTEHDISNFIRSTDRVILKAHGSIDAPNEMIFSKYQYNEARYKYSGFYKLLDSLALTHTYVFIGCGLKDPDICVFGSDYKTNCGQTGHRSSLLVHYRLIHGCQAIQSNNNACSFLQKLHLQTMLTSGHRPPSLLHLGMPKLSF